MIMKDKLLNNSLSYQGLWPLLKYNFHRKYLKRRETYAQIARENNLVYNLDDITRQVRERLGNERRFVRSSQHQDAVTVSFVSRHGWHYHLVNELACLGTVHNFDYREHGIKTKDLRDPGKMDLRKKVGALFFEWLDKIQQENRVDWVFLYVLGFEFSPEWIKKIRNEYGIPVVLMSLDTKHSWEGYPLPEGHGAFIKDFIPEADLFWSTSLMTCEWIMAEGGRPVYLSEGCDGTMPRKEYPQKDIPVSFVGAKYGVREKIVNAVRKYGIDIQAFGKGWGGRFLEEADMFDIFQRSLINLGIGGVSHSDEITILKGRDFDVPVLGGGMYITTFESHLAHHFDIGREVVCYRNEYDLIELLRYYLAHPEEAEQMAIRARDRCLTAHRWSHRFSDILNIIGLKA